MLVVGASVGLLIPDLRERCMLGDTGSNVIGAAVGWGLTIAVGATGQWIALAVVVVLDVVSETISFTKVIDRTPPLRFVDRLGAPRTPHPLTPGAGGPSTPDAASPDRPAQAGSVGRPGPVRPIRGGDGGAACRWTAMRQREVQRRAVEPLLRSDVGVGAGRGPRRRVAEGREIRSVQSQLHRQLGRGRLRGPGDAVVQDVRDRCRSGSYVATQTIAVLRR